MVTPPKFQHNKRAKDGSDINKQPVVHADADAMEVDLDTVMNLEPGEELSPEYLVQIMCRISKCKTHIVAEKWQQGYTSCCSQHDASCGIVSCFTREQGLD